MEKLLAQITIAIQTYRDLPDKLTFNDAAILSNILKNLSSDLFFLEKYRDEAARKHNTIFYNQTKNGESAAKSEVIAKESVPELYMLRRYMTSANKVQDAIRTNISFLKSEKQ